MTPEENYADITQLQAEWQSGWRDKHRWIIVEEADSTFTIHEHTRDSVYCPTEKKTAREVAARMLQLLKVGPTAPQDWPEEVCIGEIEYKSADIIPIAGESPAEKVIRLIRSTLDEPTLIDVKANCRNLTKTLMEVERILQRSTIN